MNLKNLFLEASEKLRSQSDDYYGEMSMADEMSVSDMKNWFLVHVTKYMPRLADNGELFIPTTAMATNFEIPRSTVHFALNHIVAGHLEGNWDGAPYVVVAPYMSMVEKNGNPEYVALADTWFSPNPDRGMILPNGARVVRPAQDLTDGKLIDVRGNYIVYKSANYTPEEEEMILSEFDWSKRFSYDSLEQGDKKRDALLAQQVRDMAFVACMMEMGGHVWQATSDGSAVAVRVAEVARANNFNAGETDKVHGESIECCIERDVWIELDGFLRNGFRIDGDKGGLLTLTDDLGQVFEYIKRNKNKIGVKNIIHALIGNRSIDMMGVCESKIAERANSIRNTYRMLHGVEYKGFLPANYKELSAEKPNMGITLQRWFDRVNQDFEQWRAQIQTLPEYEDFIKKLRGLANEMAIQQLMAHAGR